MLLNHGAATLRSLLQSFCYLYLMLLMRAHGQFSVPMGSIELIEGGTDSLYVKWTVPGIIESRITRFRVMARTLSDRITQTDAYLSADASEHRFYDLLGNTTYRVSSEGFQGNKSVWYISNLFHTSLAALSWLPAPSDLILIDKSAVMMDISWRTPVLAQAGLQAQVNQHLVTFAPFDPETRATLKQTTITVPMPNTRIRIMNLNPSTTYNITVQSGTDNGYGAPTWCSFSTLSEGETHILKLKSRTPTTLTIKWNAQWASAKEGYTITARTVHTVDGSPDRQLTINSFEGDTMQPEHVLRDLHPGTTFNVSLQPKGRDVAPAWGVYSTLPLGDFAVTDLRLTDETEVAASISWKPVEHDSPVHYQVRYVPNDGGAPIVEEQKSADSLHCPKYGCERLCSLTYNLMRSPRDFTFQVRVQVEEVWNKWVTAARRPWTPSDLHCSVIPPQHHIDNIGVAELYRNVTLHPNSKDKDAWRYFIVVDMRLNPVDFETADLEDKMTATAKNMPYYITAALVPSTVKDGQTFSIGDGRVHGGYLNYPLKKEDEFTWKLVAAQVSQVSSKKSHEHNIPQSCHLLEDGTLKCEPHHWLAAIPWWYILLALLLLIFSILCTLCLACVLWNLRRKSYNVRAEAAQDSSRQPLNRPDSEAA